MGAVVLFSAGILLGAAVASLAWSRESGPMPEAQDPRASGASRWATPGPAPSDRALQSRLDGIERQLQAMSLAIAELGATAASPRTAATEAGRAIDPKALADAMQQAESERWRTMSTGDLRAEAQRLL